MLELNKAASLSCCLTIVGYLGNGCVRRIEKILPFDIRTTYHHCVFICDENHERCLMERAAAGKSVTALSDFLVCQMVRYFSVACRECFDDRPCSRSSIDLLKIGIVTERCLMDVCFFLFVLKLMWTGRSIFYFLLHPSTFQVET